MPHAFEFDPIAFNPRRAMVTIHTHTKDRGQRSSGSKDRRMNGAKCITFLANAVGNEDRTGQGPSTHANTVVPNATVQCTNYTPIYSDI